MRISLIVFAFMVVLSGCGSLSVNDEYKATLKELFVSSASCAATKLLHRELPTAPVYRIENGRCQLINLHVKGDGRYYTDNTCQSDAFDYKRAHYEEFCKELITPHHDRLGNPAYWSDDPTAYWALPPSAGLSLSTLKIDENHYPFMTRARYKSVAVREKHPASGENTDKQIVTLQGLGTCDLEMRIYKRSPTEKSLKPLMVIHGGAWRFRGSAFAAFESEISHLTERGFVVFAPFYRLIGQADGNYECNNAKWPEIVSDVNDALDWVKQHGGDYGAQPGKTYLLGGSAGGHLASWLTVNRPDEVMKSLLFYPPTDFRHYAEQVQKSHSTLKGEGHMGAYIGTDDIDKLSLDSPSLQANSFPTTVAESPERFPPIAMIHGLSDQLVPSDQSVRLCNALNGSIAQGLAKNKGGDASQGKVSQRYQCGEQGMLYIINEGDHALDVCVEGIECPAGGDQSQKAVAKAMRSLFDWLAH